MKREVRNSQNPRLCIVRITRKRPPFNVNSLKSAKLHIPASQRRDIHSYTINLINIIVKGALEACSSDHVDRYQHQEHRQPEMSRISNHHGHAHRPARFSNDCFEKNSLFYDFW